MCVDEITTAMNKRLCFIAFVLVKLIYCILLIMSFSFYAHSQEMAVRIYTAKDGLPSSYVYETCQDKLGYLWIGSPYGLSRFDGKYFTNYGLSDGLPDLRTNCGFMDSRLRFWAGTTRGVAQFKGNRFIRYPLTDSQNIRWVFQIFETKAKQVWSLTNVGVYQFNLNKWYKIKLYPGYENHACRNIIETKDGIYINYGDLLVLKKTDGTYKTIGALKGKGYYYNQLTLSAGEAFISTMDGICTIIDQQLVKLPGVSGKLKDVYVYFRDSKKRLWLGNEKRGILVIADGDTAHVKSVYKGTTDILIQHISEDKLGNIWVTTGNGLIRISEMGFKFIDIPVIGKGILYNVFQPPTGPLIINNGSLSMQTFENGIFNVRRLLKGTGNRLPDNEMIIDNYAFDNKNRYWYFLRGWQLAMQEGNKLYEQNNQLSRLGNEVFDVLFDTFRKKIMVAVGTQKFPCQFNDTSYSPLVVSNNIDVKGNIRHLHQCANGTILFTTDRGFIYSVDLKNICKLQLNEVDSEGDVSRFSNDPNGDVWIIYNGRGLRCYSWQNDSLVFKEQLTKNNGLSNDNVSSLCFDDHHNLWVCANSSVTVFSKKINAGGDAIYQVVSFFDAEDLQLDNAYGTRLIKDLKGNIWLYFGNHLICFFPDKINYSPPIPLIEIENLKLNLRETNWTDYSDSLTGLFQLPYNLTLSHENNTLGIYFKGISSSGTDGIKYSYLLGGLENLWSNPSTDDFVSYVRLPPGKYNFKVKAQLPNTNWSEPAIFSFEIKKAFWQTWWFYILIGLALFTGIYVLFRYRLRQKINLLEMRNRISQDLHDEIGASISGINLLSQMAAEKLRNNETGEAADYLSKVKNYTQDVIEKLSDMVWIFNPQNDSIEKLLQRLKSFTFSIGMSKNIKIHFVTDKDSGSINLTIRQRKAIYLISKEAINNMFKYAECNNIYYGFNIKGSKWRLMIQDDGKGFASFENNNGNGLKNMQARADEIGAKFQIKSQPGAGTIITLES
jgi:ligand-binding sensor domain-containing protein/two-component sensor histidine kinase